MRLSHDIDRYHNLECHVSAHVENSSATCNAVHIGIFQSVQMTLVCLVQQVVGGDVKLCNLLAIYVYICAC